MSSVPVLNLQGERIGELSVPDAWLVTDRGDQTVYEVVVATLARRRAGTASTRNKGAVAGSGAKPWRQKGTGRARAGYRQSPVWRGGGVAFGPHPRSFAIKTNRKVARLAFRRVLSDRILRGDVRVVEGLEAAEPRARWFRQVRKALGLDGGGLLLVDVVNPKLTASVRNTPNIEVVRAQDVQVYDVLRFPVVCVSRTGWDGLVARLCPEGQGVPQP